eukprot:Trichotokara_eunicae@DN4938_c0_g1_i2.p1
MQFVHGNLPHLLASEDVPPHLKPPFSSLKLNLRPIRYVFETTGGGVLHHQQHHTPLTPQQPHTPQQLISPSAAYGVGNMKEEKPSPGFHVAAKEEKPTPSGPPFIPAALASLLQGAAAALKAQKKDEER